MIKKPKLLCVSYFTKNIIIIIIRVWVGKKEVITLINKNEINTITITFVKKIKEFFETKCKSNLKDEIIEKVLIEIKREFLRINIFEIENSARSYLIMRKQ